MLQIRLDGVSASEGLAGVQPSPVEAATITCPDHLVLANLPVAKGIHSAKAASLVKNLGRKSHRQLGERVHICVRCDFPIAIYGRLSPCEHAFCLDCARSDSICYLCYERIQKIQKIKMMKGIFICAAPHCLKSFLEKSEFDLHIQDIHADLIWPNTDKDGNESETPSVWQTTVLDSSTRGPQRPFFSTRSNSQPHDRENKAHLQPPTDQPSLTPTLQPKRPLFGQVQTDPSDPQFVSAGGIQQGFHQQSFDMQQTPKEPCQFAYRHQGVAAENPFPDYSPVHSAQPPNIAMPIISNPMLNPPMPLGYPPYSHGGVPPFYVDPYEMFRHESLLGFPLGAACGPNFPANYPQPLNAGTSGVPFEQAQSGMAMDQMDAKGISAPQPMPPLPPPPPPPSHMPLPPPPPPPPPRPHMPLPPPLPPPPPTHMPLPPPPPPPPRPHMPLPLPPPPPPPTHMPLPPPPPPPAPHMPHLNQRYYSGEFGHDDHGYGWQNDNHDAFGGQD